MRIVTLLSDFGLKDGYVAQMKGVVLDTCPDATIMDISHEIERHNILMGSFILETTVPYFPKGTIHVAVIDPGVGSDRRAILIECETGLLVGPDNGLMARASERLGLKTIRQIPETFLGTSPTSNTFHGRDIFARVAGMLARGKGPEEIGRKISAVKKLNLDPVRFDKSKLMCQVLHVDNFGNIITNVEKEQPPLLQGPWAFIYSRIGREVTIKSGKKEFSAKVVESYHQLSPDSVGVLLGSQGYVEIAVREGSASQKLGVKPIDELEIRL